MTLLICDADNQAQFRAQLKALAPEAHALARDLYALGMIEGLRGMALAACPPGLPWPAGVTPTLSLPAEIRLKEGKPS